MNVSPNANCVAQRLRLGAVALSLSALTATTTLFPGTAHAATSNEQVTRAVTDGIAFVEKTREMKFKSTPSSHK